MGHEVLTQATPLPADFAAMAATIAVITALYCLTLCAFAEAVSAKVKAHRRLAQALEKLAGVFLIGFGIKLGTQ